MVSHIFIEGISTLCLTFGVLYTQNIVLIGIIYTLLLMLGSAYTYGFSNPALTFAMAVAGKISKSDVMYYWLAQFIGALVALQFYVSLQRV